MPVGKKTHHLLSNLALESNPSLIKASRKIPRIPKVLLADKRVFTHIRIPRVQRSLELERKVYCENHLHSSQGIELKTKGWSGLGGASVGGVCDS